MTPLDELYASTVGAGDAYARGYVRRHIHLLEHLDLAAIAAISRLLMACWDRGRTIFCAGNGGSAATASHFATDLSWGLREGIRTPPRVVSLAANTPLLTAVGNDVGYQEVFVEQMRGLFQTGDVLLAISASGNSENILRAVQFANDRGGHTIGLTGFDGGRLKALCTMCLHVETPRGEYELVEDVHHAVCHMVATFVKRCARTPQPAPVVADARPVEEVL